MSVSVSVLVIYIYTLCFFAKSTSSRVLSKPNPNKPTLFSYCVSSFFFIYIYRSACLTFTLTYPLSLIPNLNRCSATSHIIAAPAVLMESVELKVEMAGIHEKRLRKCLSKVKGIEKVEVEGKREKVVVTGYAHRNKILKAVRRGGLKADFWSPHNDLLHAYASATYASFTFQPFNFF